MSSARCEVPYLIIGGGVASASAIDALLKRGVPGSQITLVTADAELPYHRPPLSKGYLLGRQERSSVFVKPALFYEEAQMRVRLNTAATGLAPSTQMITLSTGETIRYEKLLIATGCSPRRLAVPGGDLPGITTLRTLADSDRLKAAIPRAKRALVVGGSFIGMELASAFAQRDVQTTVLHRGIAIFEKLQAPEASAFFASVFADHGVTIRLEEEVLEIRQERDRLRVLTTRGEGLPADLVAVGIGVTPDTDWLNDSGVPLDHGVVVDAYLASAVPQIFAAGDVAKFFDPLFGHQRRIEHWETAIQHGKIAATNMVARDSADRVRYDHVSSFFSDIFDLSFDYFGDPTGTNRVIRRGSFDERAVTLFFLTDAVVRAAFTMGRPRERAALITMIKQQRPVGNLEAFTDPARPLPTI